MSEKRPRAEGKRTHKVEYKVLPDAGRSYLSPSKGGLTMQSSNDIAYPDAESKLMRSGCVDLTRRILDRILGGRQGTEREDDSGREMARNREGLSLRCGGIVYRMVTGSHDILEWVAWTGALANCVNIPGHYMLPHAFVILTIAKGSRQPASNAQQGRGVFDASVDDERTHEVTCRTPRGEESREGPEANVAGLEDSSARTRTWRTVKRIAEERQAVTRNSAARYAGADGARGAKHGARY
ncbi:hypothetical protein DFH09DRAFT_1101791 [Mycena vulgaris]|nr:hypothetical protein DFH09DRAFT_1101791 [Mycena vulgaris]